LPAGPFAEIEGPRSKSAAGLFIGLAAHTPIRTRHEDGTQNCLRLKGPILCDVISAPADSHYADRGTFCYPAIPNKSLS